MSYLMSSNSDQSKVPLTDCLIPDCTNEDVPIQPKHDQLDSSSSCIYKNLKNRRRAELFNSNNNNTSSVVASALPSVSHCTIQRRWSTNEYQTTFDAPESDGCVDSHISLSQKYIRCQQYSNSSYDRRHTYLRNRFVIRNPKRCMSREFFFLLPPVNRSQQQHVDSKDHHPQYPTNKTNCCYSDEELLLLNLATTPTHVRPQHSAQINSTSCHKINVSVCSDDDNNCSSQTPCDTVSISQYYNNCPNTHSFLSSNAPLRSNSSINNKQAVLEPFMTKSISQPTLVTRVRLNTDPDELALPSESLSFTLSKKKYLLQQQKFLQKDSNSCTLQKPTTVVVLNNNDNNNIAICHKNNIEYDSSFSPNGGECTTLMETLQDCFSSSNYSIQNKKPQCDACNYCDDICSDTTCKRCLLKKKKLCIRYQQCLGAKRLTNPTLEDLSRITRHVIRTMKQNNYFTPCEIRRHTIAQDCWLVAHGVVYDATPYLACHPGGPNCILRKAGCDVSRDFDFHTKYAQKGPWESLKIGKVVPCQGCPNSDLIPPSSPNIFRRIINYLFK